MRIPITITGSADGALSDYQVKVTIPYYSGMDANFGNLYFKDSDAVTELSFWIEYHFNYELAVCWVKVPSIPASPTTKTIYAYYDAFGSNNSDDSGTFLVGADFDDSATTGLTINLAGSATASVVEGSTLLNLNLGRAGKYAGNPVINLGANGTWDDAAIREFCIVIDENGYNVVESDGLWAYYGAYDGSVWKIGLAKSTDSGLTWTKYGSNPVLVGAGSSWYQNGISAPSVTKLNNGSYIMAAVGWNASNIRSIGVLSSSDGLSWSDEGQKITLSDIHDGATNIAELGVPRMLKCSDGTWRLLLEGRTNGITNGWKIYGATASNPASTWTVMNSGDPVFSKTGAGWESVGVANPTFIEVTAGNYLMAYNGINTAWQVGFASTSDFSTWTRNTDNPVISPDPISGVWDDFYTETSFLTKDINSSHIRMYYQGYEDGSIVRVGLALIPQGKVLNAKDTASASDGWVVGIDLDAYSTFIFEAQVNNTKDVNDAGNVQIGLMDFSAVPSPTTNTTWNAAARLLVLRNTASNSPNRNQFFIIYNNSAGTTFFWNGSSWTTSAPSYWLHEGEVKIVIWDDGTNYKVDIQNRKGTSLLANVASIAKTSVKSFSNGRTFVLTEPFTNFYYSGTDLDNLILRKFTANPPSLSVGSPESVDEIAPDSIASAEAFGSPVVSADNYAVFPSAIAGAEAFGSPTIEVGVIHPDSIASAEAFGVPSVVAIIAPASIDGAEAFGSPALYELVFYKPVSRIR